MKLALEKSFFKADEHSKGEEQTEHPESLIWSFFNIIYTFLFGYITVV